MKLHDYEKVAGTGVTIGRRIQFRTVDGARTEQASRTYTAVYKDVDGKWRQDGLKTTSRLEARRKAIEIQGRLEEGRTRTVAKQIAVDELLDRYDAYCTSKGLAPKTLIKYRAEIDKLRGFCTEEKITAANRFDEVAFYRFKAWLADRTHKQGTSYASKSVYTTLTVCKQVFKWAWRVKLLTQYELAGAELPSARPRPQPCFTTEQVEQLRAATEGVTRDAITILAYSGMRVGELEQLRWADVLLDRGELGVFHIRRGGSSTTTKDKDERFVPVHPEIRPVLDRLPRKEELVLPGLRARTLLTQVKRACGELGFGRHYKVHSFRHHFASMCANSSVPHRMALAWMGHSSSHILDLYYHLHDAESEAAMKIIAADLQRNR